MTNENQGVPETAGELGKKVKFQKRIGEGDSDSTSSEKTLGREKERLLTRDRKKGAEKKVKDWEKGLCGDHSSGPRGFGLEEKFMKKGSWDFPCNGSRVKGSRKTKRCACSEIQSTALNILSSAKEKDQKTPGR